MESEPGHGSISSRFTFPDIAITEIAGVGHRCHRGAGDFTQFARPRSSWPMTALNRTLLTGYFGGTGHRAPGDERPGGPEAAEKYRSDVS